MEIIEQSHEIIKWPETPIADIERVARTCYKTEHKITAESGDNLVKKLIDKGHDPMLEFADITVKFITNRAMSHEIARHRLCSFAQESQRYVNYNNRPLQFIKPVWADKNPEAYQVWQDAMIFAETHYPYMVDGLGMTPQQARDILPNSTKTEINVKANVREWRHIASLRTSPAADPMMQALMKPLINEFAVRCPLLFGDLATPIDYDKAKVTYEEGPHD